MILLVLFAGIMIGYMITHTTYDIGYHHGWHQGVEDVIAIMEGEELNGDQ